MNSLELLKILIEKLEIYESKAADKRNLSLEGFYQSIAPSIDLEDLKNTFLEKRSNLTFHPAHGINLERVIAQHLLFLYRYIKFYAKQAFTGTLLNSVEEFSFMATAMQYPSISKSELIRKNVIEKSSGIEIIKRLIKSGIFVQFDNPEDQRSQLIALTDYGKMQLFQSFEKMNTLGYIATGELSESEKENLAVLLKKLDTFHHTNYHNKNIETLDDYLPQSFKQKD